MAAPKIARENPNATVAAGGGGVGVVVVWVLGLAGVDISPEVAAVIAGAIPTVALFIGRNGLKGAICRIWRGDPDGADT